MSLTNANSRDHRLRCALRFGVLAAVLLILGSGLALAQGGLALPPSGENQKSSVTQYIGPVSVTIDYSSPDVTGPQGQDRRGQIWGQTVPYGLNNLGFGPATAAPWRAGANENTVITVSHDVQVQGKALAAGTYGLHVIAEESGPWTVIFSNNSTAWGSFFYNEREDALRVEATPETSEFREWLTYDFVDRQPKQATVALRWEEKSLPFTFSVPDRDQLYMSSIRQQLQNSPGFNWQNWVGALNYALTTNQVTDEMLGWANTAVTAPFVGQENFTTLSTQSRIQTALGKTSDAAATMDKALRHRTATALQIHTQARQLQAQGNTARAVEIFKLNQEFNGDVWPVTVGLARAYSAEGEFKKALKYAKLAAEQAPDQGNQQNLQTIIGLLKEGKDFNASN